MASSLTLIEHIPIGPGGVITGIGTVVGPGFDTQGLEELLVCVPIGSTTPTGSLNITVEHSEDDGNNDPYVAIPNANFSTKVVGDAGKIFIGRLATNLPGRKRFVRATLDVSGDVMSSGVFFVGHGRHFKPVVHQNSIEFNLDELVQQIQQPPAGDPYEGLKSNPFDFGTIPPGGTSAVSLTLPGNAEIFLQVTNLPLGASSNITLLFTNPVESNVIQGPLAINTPMSGGNHVTGQDLSIDNFVAEVSAVNFELLVDSTVIAFGTCAVLG